MKTYKCLNPKCGEEFDKILDANCGGGVSKANCPKCNSYIHGIVNIKTDLEKVKELFDSVGIKYTHYEYPNNNGLTLQIELPDDSTVIYDFDTKGKYSEIHVVN